MIPIRDTTPSNNYPVINNSIIGINVVLYLIEMTHGMDINRFLFIYGLVPARYSMPELSLHFTPFQQIFSVFSFMFLHGGFWHLLSNMWSLYIFGDNVEDRLGHVRYFFFYILCGLTSGLSHLLFNLYSDVPVIGASGAIAGVMGAYLLLHPYSKILTLIPIIFIPWFVEIPAFFFLGFWFLMQFINAAGSHGGASNIAWWAHVGGFIFGMVFLKLFRSVPYMGFTDKIQHVTAKKKTHHLQVIRPVGLEHNNTLYGTMIITPYEAATGCSKLVNISWRFHKKFLRVNVPKGIKEDGILRLKGLGKQGDNGVAGDLLLKINISL